MANTSDLGFNVFALDKASKTFLAMAEKVERLSDKLEELDRQDARPEINIDIDRPLRKISRFSATSSGILSGAMKIVSANAALMGTALVGAIMAAPALAALAASGMVLAFGGAFAAIGIAAAAQNKEIRKEFTALKDHVVDTLKEISVPFQGTLRTIADVARDVFDTFAPELKSAFKEMAPVLSTFVKQFGEAFKELKPAIEPLTDAFIEIMEELGPRLGPLFEEIADSIVRMAETVAENDEVLVDLIEFLISGIPRIIDAITLLTEFFADLVTTFTLGWETFKDQLQSVKEIAVTVFSTIGLGWLAFQKIVLKGIRFVVDSFLGFVSTLLTGAAKAFSWVPGVGDKLQTAKEEFDKFRDGVSSTLGDAIRQTEEWENALRRMPKEVKLEGNIQDLEQKIDRAKDELKDPDLTDPERTKIRARIGDLQNKVRQAKDELNSIRDETVNITALVNIPSHIGAGIGGSGGLLMAEGGRFRHGDVALVGEQGPELVRFSGSGEVIPNRESMRMIDRAGAAGGGDEIHFHGVREDVIMARLERRQRLRMAMAR